MRIVVFPVHNLYMDATLCDFLKMSEVSECQYPKNKLLKRLQYYHTSIKANKYFRLPFHSAWYSTYVPKQNEDETQYVFLFYQGTPLGYDVEFLHYLKNKYKGSKLCFYWNNIASTTSEYYVNLVNKEYDVIYTFEKNDVKRYGWRFYDVMYSDVSKWKLPQSKPSDIFFVGSAKNRLSLIHNIYDKFQAMGYKCDFHIVNVSQKDQTRDGIVYNKRISYEEVLGRCASTKVILEVVQEGQTGPTLRSYESIILKKRLLTNNFGIKESKVNSSAVLLFKTIEDIHPESIINSQLNTVELDKLSEYLKPQRFINDLNEACSF